MPEPSAPFLGWFILTGTLLGGLLAFFPGIIHGAITTRSTRRQTASLLRAEIDAILTLTEARGDRRLMENAVPHLRAGKPLALPPLVSADLPLDPAYAATLPTIGLLSPDLARDVIAFYRWLRSQRFELLQIPDLATNAPQDAAARIDRLSVQWEDLAKLGRDLLPRLAETAGLK